MNVNEIISNIQSNLVPEKYLSEIFQKRGEDLFYKDNNLSSYSKIHLLGIGKSSSNEISSFKRYIEKSSICISFGLVMSITKKGFAVEEDFLQFQNDHPEITIDNIKNSQNFVSRLKVITSNDLIIFFLSGGASALFEIPDEGISPSEIIKRNKSLIESGLSINEINQKRKEFSKVKNGGLIHLIPTSNILQLITCDIANAKISDVGSGPLINDELKSDIITEVYRSADKLLEKLQSNTLDIGKVYNCSLIEMVNDLLLNLPSKGRGIISGGEATIELPLNYGKGGRNTHFVLYMANILYQKEENRDLHILSFATDGDDGNTHCAGAYINWNLYQQVDPQEFLSEYNSYEYFRVIGSLIEVSSTKSNVMDIRYIWREI